MLLLQTSSVFLLVFGLWKSVNLVHTYSVGEEKNSKLEEKYKNSKDRNEFLEAEVSSKMNSVLEKNKSNYPIVINTWPFVNATAKAWDVLIKTDNRLDAVVAGCTECEILRCDGTVGFGGSPDEHGDVALDALIMDGVTHDAGAVANLKRIKNAIGVARAVMDYTTHTFLVGESATQFAIDMGFQQEDLHAIESMQKWIDWFNNSCQPNFRINVFPDPTKMCGPYKPIENRFDMTKVKRFNKNVSEKSHDTIGMIAIDSNGDIAVGTSTNGASHKIPGRVGDSPIIGSGAYVDNDVGAACGTGDGDTLMKYLPAYQTVESMRNGMDPSQAANDAINRIVKIYPNFVGAIIAMNKFGYHGAGCHGIPTFHYSVKDMNSSDVRIIEVSCI